MIIVHDNNKKQT